MRKIKLLSFLLFAILLFYMAGCDIKKSYNEATLQGLYTSYYGNPLPSSSSDTINYIKTGEDNLKMLNQVPSAVVEACDYGVKTLYQETLNYMKEELEFYKKVVEKEGTKPGFFEALAMTFEASSKIGSFKENRKKWKEEYDILKKNYQEISETKKN